ncbi:MAG: purine-nucleoside phosphorylase [Chitinophagaceae bacterium]|nr:MAG: purine-nucleoside phosphorylase [Chitinophagaceae bacterium]
MLQKLDETTAFLQSNGFLGAAVGVVLGTGLGSFIDLMQVEQAIAYQDIPHFPVATVEFHQGRLIIGTIGDKKVIAMQGRFHYYEGYSMQQVTFPVRVMKNLGISCLLLSNAAGGMNPHFSKGDLVLINDHINMLPENPLRGLNDPAFGNRFVDMSEPYSPYLNEIFAKNAAKLNIDLKEGVYVSVMGPNLETRAEYRQLRSAGADMVGMSTVPEVIVANHIALKCVITDECDPDNLKPVNINEIIAVAGKADAVLSELFKETILALD